MKSDTPSLILLDCQRDQVEGPDGGIDPENQAVVKRLSVLLQHARSAGWSICHCQFDGDGPESARQPLERLRPNTREPVFVRRGLSAFSDSYFHQILARNAGRPCLLTGFSAPFSILATVFDAKTRGRELIVVPEAVGSLAVEPRSVADTREMAFDLIARLAPVMSWDAMAGRWMREPAEPV